MAEINKSKYDRQLRIWGEQGQSALERARVCLLNCGPTGSETLKNLVLGGVGSVMVVDGSKVEVADLGNNFLVDNNSIGQSRAKCVCTFLRELNDAVGAKFVEEPPEALLERDPSFFSQFTLIIATQLPENALLKLDRICRQQNGILIIARSYGLTGLVRISLKEHDVVESKPVHFASDLRLHKPWPELKRFVDGFNIHIEDPVIHKNIPYVVILVKLAEEWKHMHNGLLPVKREEQKQFTDNLINKMISLDEDNYKEARKASFEVWASSGISSHLRCIINDSSAEVSSNSSDFWVLVAALKEFVANEGEGEVPLEGSIPDMTSLTEYYVDLQKVYQAKAEADSIAVESRVRTILKNIGRDPDSIPNAAIKNFCKNAKKLRVCRYRSLEDEFKAPVSTELQKYLGDENYSGAVGFYILLRAVDHFATAYNRYPGVFDGEVVGRPRIEEMDEDVSRLKTIAVGLLNDMGCNGAKLSEDLISEMCRFGASEIHSVAAFVGGVASQEAIKLITKQFVPLTATFVFNGIDHKSQQLRL
ncbi:NEDD8-activating enzyme E1 regulatory subunit AXL isoform X2 [Cryptomeria japonica]|uniref:NEDD8-activating enzyme E1 regulatory subunit AXL isoform X2 n=1 Tax=Cryptomeria japonica TaxID=3369 RepID=UPI0027DA1403|nr:NEDD8-activating enzyme E1 regulatory subunit AXL isoform X2 [Cryptomeria japonica]